MYFYNPNIHPEEEYYRRLEAQRTLCRHFGVELIEESYEPDKFFEHVKGFENFTTSIVISPHKNFKKLSSIGENIANQYGLNFEAIDFKKKDGFLKTNKIANSLSLYRQNYCGCKFSMR